MIGHARLFENYFSDEHKTIVYEFEKNDYTVTILLADNSLNGIICLIDLL